MQVSRATNFIETMVRYREYQQQYAQSTEEYLINVGADTSPMAFEIPIIEEMLEAKMIVDSIDLMISFIGKERASRQVIVTFYDEQGRVID